MGVKTALAATAPIPASITQAESLGIDVPGNLALLALKCQEVTALMKLLNTDVFTPASDATAAAIMAAQVTAMA